MSTYIICITIIGIASLAMAWMPSLTNRTKISYAIIYVLVGALFFSVIPALPDADPLKHQGFTLRMTELVVIVSIMGTGLKIDEPFSLKTWIVPLRLVTVTMLFSIAVVAWVTWYFFDVHISTAILLGAVLAPTDPVLASDVQVGPPLDNEKDNTRFTLTAEAGMNDGMAFPFTCLAVALAAATGSTQETLLHWAWMDVLYRIAGGVFVGYAMGKLLAFLVIYLPEKRNFIVIRDGFVGVAATLLVYGLTELIHSYGFIAVFVTAITLRNSEMHHKYHKKLHSFTDQIEKIFVAIVLLLLGGAVVSGILKSLTVPWAIFGLLFLVVIRPLTALVAMIKVPYHFKEKMAISFFGIRGIGSFFYLAFALSEARFDNTKQLWAVVAFIVLASIIIHGLSATTVIKSLSGKYPHIEEITQQEKTGAER
ncbi:MAG: cation:proton antiporter [Bacteroidota bacterium]|nr:cation:proton antiporter [Bacteroidota bacterium]